MSRLLALLVACCLLLPAAACKDKDDPAEPEAPDACFETADAVVAAFAAVYVDQNLAAYRDDLLAPGFTFVLTPQAVIDHELPDDVLDYAAEVATTTAMFSGRPNALGEVLASIEVEEFTAQGGWLEVQPSDPNFGDVPGALVRTYAITMFFNITGEQRYEVSGLQLIYVTGDFCHLLGQVDLTGDGKGVEGASWSDIKALWWPR